MENCLRVWFAVLVVSKGLANRKKLKLSAAFTLLRILYLCVTVFTKAQVNAQVCLFLVCFSFFIFVSWIKKFCFVSVAKTERRSIEDDVEYVADSLSFY